MHDEVRTESDLHIDPIRSPEAIQRIKDRLAQHPRDLLLFTLGINNGVRAGDLLRVTVNDVREATAGSSVMIREKHAAQNILLSIPHAAHAALVRYLERLDPPRAPTNMYLFASREGWTPLKTQVLDALVREWTAAAGIEGRFGAHTLRKTFGYHQRTRYGVGFDVLAQRFGHPSASVTARYLGMGSEIPPQIVLAEL